MQHWKSKPADYLGHLLGHEAVGSILSYLRAQSWAVGCMAGLGDEGSEHASCHGLFSFQVTLSEAGLLVWRQVVDAVYQYIGMLRETCRKWPEWIYQELRRIHEVSYQYCDEPSPDEAVEAIVENMAPHFQMPAERLLDGSSLLFEFDPAVIQDLLDNYFTPENARIDLTSSSFGSSTDYKDVYPPKELTETTISNLVILKETSDGSFDPASVGVPQVEPMFGTLFWCHSLPSEVIEEWSRLAQPQSPSLPLSLPPQNPFVPTQFDLKALPDDDAHHPLLNSSMKLCIVVGKTKQWFPATVVQYNRKKNAVLLSYEDEAEQWHTLDEKEADLSDETLKRDFEGTMDEKKIKYRVVALAKPGQGAIRMFGDDSDFDVHEGKGFPAIPPALPPSRLPQQIANTSKLILITMQWMEATLPSWLTSFLVPNLLCRRVENVAPSGPQLSSTGCRVAIADDLRPSQRLALASGVRRFAC
jgi:hypothetical protein